MPVKPMLKTPAISPFPNPSPAHSVRLRALMDEVHREEIGNRILELREGSEQTNRSIADHCGVNLRTVAGWIAGDGISYANAKKVAKLFGVSITWLWSGEEKAATPDPFATEPEWAERIEERLDELLTLLQAADAKRRADAASPADAPPATPQTQKPQRRRPAS